MKLAILHPPNGAHFLDGLVRKLREHHTVRLFPFTYEGAHAPAFAWADVVWIEWAEQLAAAASHAQGAFGKPIVVRLHSYEAFTEWPRRIAWEKVAACIFVANHVREIVAREVTALETRTRCVTIPNGVDLDAFPLQHHDGSQHRVGVVANVSGKKNPEMWLQVLAELPGDYHLHVAGRMDDRRFAVYLPHMAERLDVADRFHLDGYVRDIVTWWADKDFLLSTSPHEGCPLNVLEAMALGVCPVVHHYRGADTLPGRGGRLFLTAREAAHGITAPWFNHLDPALIRAYICEEHFSLDAQAAATRELLESIK